MTQPTNVYQLLMDMVKHEQNFGAYWIYLALTKGYLQKHDPIDSIYDVTFTEINAEHVLLVHALEFLLFGISSMPHSYLKISKPSTLPKVLSMRKCYMKSISDNMP